VPFDVRDHALEVAVATHGVVNVNNAEVGQRNLLLEQEIDVVRIDEGKGVGGLELALEDNDVLA
jgi:hypothetical protein